MPHEGRTSPLAPTERIERMTASVATEEGRKRGRTTTGNNSHSGSLAAPTPHDQGQMPGCQRSVGRCNGVSMRPGRSSKSWASALATDLCAGAEADGALAARGSLGSDEVEERIDREVPVRGRAVR